MSTLYLIRHGQASFGADDYDVLSEIGAQQSRALGGFFAERGQRLDAIYVGPRRRQIDTAHHLLAEAREAGAEYPEPIRTGALDEYPAFALLRHWMPILAAEDPTMAEIMSAPAGSARLERGFEYIIGKWVAGELDTGEHESYGEFVARVEAGLKAIMEEQGRGKQVAVVTSGGPISVAMRRTLGLADDMMLRVAWVVANASLSVFRYRAAEKLTMVSFNNTPHLLEPGLLTYR